MGKHGRKRASSESSVPPAFASPVPYPRRHEQIRGPVFKKPNRHRSSSGMFGGSPAPVTPPSALKRAEHAGGPTSNGRQRQSKRALNDARLVRSTSLSHRCNAEASSGSISCSAYGAVCNSRFTTPRGHSQFCIFAFPSFPCTGCCTPSQMGQDEE